MYDTDLLVFDVRVRSAQEVYDMKQRAQHAVTHNPQSRSRSCTYTNTLNAQHATRTKHYSPSFMRKCVFVCCAIRQLVSSPEVEPGASPRSVQLTRINTHDDDDGDETHVCDAVSHAAVTSKVMHTIAHMMHAPAPIVSGVEICREGCTTRMKNK